MWLKGEEGVLVKCGLSGSSVSPTPAPSPHSEPTLSQLSEDIKLFLQEVT